MTNIHSPPPVFIRLQGLYNVKGEPRVCSVNVSTEMEEVYSSCCNRRQESNCTRFFPRIRPYDNR